MSETTTLTPDSALVLPDGNLIIDGLPPDLRVVPNKHDGESDWVGRWFAWNTRLLEWRTAFKSELDANPKLWALEREEIKRHGAMYLAAAHLHVWEPRYGEALGFGAIPFGPMPFQIRVADFIESRIAGKKAQTLDAPFFGHGIIDKPRAVGVTWAISAIVFKGLMVDVPFDARLMSKTEADVDKRDQKGTLFGKLDVFYQNMPAGLRFRGFSPRLHRNYLVFTNPETGAQAIGEATTQTALRGDRGTIFFGDEAAFWPNLLETIASIFGATPNAFLLSSFSDEVSRDFQTIVDNFKENYPGSVLSIESDENPLQQDEWKAAKQKEYAALGQVGVWAFKREFEKESGAGIAKYIYPEAMDVPLTGEPINPRTETIIGLDPGRDDEFGITLWQERGIAIPGQDLPPVDLVWSWMGKGKDARFIASLLVGRPITGLNGYSYSDGDLLFAAVMERLGRVYFCGCPGGTQKGAGDDWYTSIDKEAQALVSRRIAIHVSHANKDRHLPGKRDAFRRLLKRTRCLDHPVPRMALRAFRENQYQKRPRNRPGVSEAWQDEHDWTSHLTESGEIVAVHLDLMAGVQGAMAIQSKPAYASPHGVDRLPKMVPTVSRMW